MVRANTKRHAYLCSIFLGLHRAEKVTYMYQMWRVNSCLTEFRVQEKPESPRLVESPVLMESPSPDPRRPASSSQLVVFIVS